jgi:hypothetical protein
MPELLFTGPSERGWSRLGTFLQCPQKYAWAYKLDKRSKDHSQALIRGSLMHVALAHHYARKKEDVSGGNPDIYYKTETAVKIAAAEEGEVWKQHVDLVLMNMDRYKVKYPCDPWIIKHVEKEAELDVGGNRITGRFDLVIEDTQGKVYIVDHKTTARLHKRQRTYYSISGQILAYKWMGRTIWGDRFGGMLLNQIQHGGGDPKKIKFARHVVEPAPNLERMLPVTVMDAENAIQRLEAEERDPRWWPRATHELVCFHRYGACEYLELCKYGE